MAAILNSATLDSAILHKTLTQTNSIWLNSFILTQLDDVSHLEFCLLLVSHFEQKKLHSFILTQLDDGSHLEFCHVGFRHCHLGLRHLVIFSQIHSKHSHSTLTLTQTNSIWLNSLTFSLHLMMDSATAILNSAILDLLWDLLKNTLTPLWLWLKLIHCHFNLMDGSHLEFYHLGFSHFAQIKTSLIHSDSTWWWQPSWILPSWIWPSWIQPS